MKKICEKENVMICQYDLLLFVEKINVYDENLQVDNNALFNYVSA